MDNITEQELPKPEIVVRLGEEFHPFDPNFTTYDIGFKSSAILSTDKGNLDFTIATMSGLVTFSKSFTVTPFNPNLAYIIDNQDFLLETRKQKFLRIKSAEDADQEGRKKNYSGAPETLYFSCTPLDTEKNPEFYKKLRLILEFPQSSLSPGSRFQSNSTPEAILEGGIFFTFFYPTDTPPLPTTDEKGFGNMREGFTISLPKDPDKLAQIRARFVMVEEQPQEDTT